MKPDTGKKPAGKTLSGEDRLLWNRVAETVTPRPGRAAHLLKDDMARLLEAASSPKKTSLDQPPSKHKHAATLPLPPVSAPRIARSHPIEEVILRKLAKGRQSIDSRIDLHGMTQDRARFALLDFLQQAQVQGHRIVLVITGKGNEGRGVLRTSVPQWLELPGFRELVNGYRQSHISHGGEGALYLRLHHHPKSRRKQ